MATKFSPTSVKRPRLQVEDQLREAIASGQLKQGEKLPSEAALAELFGVSRVTVREALRSLGASGLIHTQPGASGGSFIRTLGAAELAEMIAVPIRATLALGTVSRDDIRVVRELLEVPAARLAATNRSAMDVTEIRGALDASDADAENDKPSAAAFGALVAKSTHNDVLSALLGAMRQLTEPVADTDSARGANSPTQREVLEAIAAGDPDQAEKCSRRHVLESARTPASASPKAARKRAPKRVAGAR
ncbi:GntR family transcriptional regulator [Jatrophihabitans cynanchi]|uniref:GntR family transcriptional regulator n=1 Tax=Jatrophihabitans cynanchi TaxID=2944128 RepID=A0ABY7K514_9ACTN|nr:GntR family transcriptional regulator [Jatrophihabitans sp. SB3-54]WAX58366.1 GntR family transcriptional regulator [Jatrophihabitans sp. SB3-54]